MDKQLKRLQQVIVDNLEVAVQVVESEDYLKSVDDRGDALFALSMARAQLDALIQKLDVPESKSVNIEKMIELLNYKKR